MSLFTSSSFLLVFHVIPLLAVLLLFFTHPNVLRSSTSSSSSWTVTWNFPSSSSSISRAFYSWVEVQPANGLSNETIDIVASHHEVATAHQQPPPPFSSALTPAPTPTPAPSPTVTKLDGEEESTEDRNISSSSTTGRASVANKTVLTRLQKIERSLLKARSSIREAAAAAGDNYQQLIIRNSSSISSSKGTTLLIDADDDPDYIPRGPIYRNSKAFHRSYLEMEKLLKIYVYEEGELPIFHNGPCKSIYSSEGTFIHEMEMNQVFRTTDPNEALLYFLPFSVSMMVSYLYDAADRQNLNGIKVSVTDYINLIANKYPFWNRSLGADHFMLSCHDWGPRTSSFVPNLYHKSIRVLCNANTSEGFNPSKDASLPEINILTGETPSIGGSSPFTRTVLGFFAGHLHGYIRYLLLQQWKNKDRDLQVYEELPRGLSYQTMMKKSKFCLCPSGYEVASPRIVEAIYAECVPVLISDGYVPPFSDVLKWKSFSVMVKVKDIPNIKNILMGISQRQYLRLHRRLKQVQRHFVVNSPPKRYDVFHMILHSVWLRRLNIRIDDLDP